MPARAAWKGFLQVNKLTVAVKAFTAVSTTPEISLNQLHRNCGQRIRQQKVCPTHGIVTQEDIISGFEYSQGEYLPLESEDLQALYPADNKSIAVECFVPSRHIDPVYHSGRTYYLVPDGPPGQRPFCLLREGMRQCDRHAVAQVVVGHAELLVLLRPMKRVVAMTVLEYPQRVRPAADYETEVSGLETSPREQDLIQQIITSMTNAELDITDYRDTHTDRLNTLIQDRLAHFQAPQLAETSAMEGGLDEESALVAALTASLFAPQGPGPRPQAMRRPREDTDHANDTEDSTVRKLG